MSEIERDRELEERLARAPREAAPARDLWPALARAVGEERRGDPGPGASHRIPRLPLRIAAAIALFAGGVVVGQRWEDPAPASPPAPATASPLDAAAEVQRAGTEYVTALSRLDATGGALERDQGVEAALSALQGAAYELVRLRPGDPQAGRILYTVSEARADGDGTEPTVRF
ncbi:MAG: hypothetical protein ABR559_03525 [Gemmatimonadota bacterium]